MIITWEEFLAGWISGVGGLIASHPIDTAKVRYQNSPLALQETLKEIVYHEGIRSFYKGMFLPSIMAGVQNAVYFGIYANCLRVFTNGEVHERSLAMKEIFSAGCCGAMGQVLLTTPIETIKVKLQTRTGKAKVGGSLETPDASVAKCIQNTFKTEGIRGFYRAFVPTVIRDVPTGGLYICLYTSLDHLLISWKMSDYTSHLLAGGIAGTLSFIPVIPMDMIKTKMQADNTVCPDYKGTMDTLTKSIEKHGYKVLLRGLGLNCVRSFIFNASMFCIYEYCCHHFYND